MVGLDVLLVDRDEEFARAMAESMRRDGHRLYVATDSATATQLASELQPDVVVLDVQFDTDAYRLAHTLRTHLPAATPIIVVTGLPQVEMAEDFDLVLSKPVPSDLFAGLVAYIRRNRRRTITARVLR